MVNSILDKNIKYAEKNALIEEDINYETDLYEISLFGVDIDIAVGMAKYDYVEQNIIYYPVYLVKESFVVAQIGVYEIVVSEMINVVDNDNMLDLTLINKILLYSFVTKSFISKEQKENEIMYIELEITKQSLNMLDAQEQFLIIHINDITKII